MVDETFTQQNIDQSRLMYEHTNDFIGGDPLADSFVFTVFDGDDGLIAENIFNILIEPPFLILKEATINPYLQISMMMVDLELSIGC